VIHLEHLDVPAPDTFAKKHFMDPDGFQMLCGASVKFKDDALKRGDVSPVRAVLVVGKAGHSNSLQISRLADAKSRSGYRESETTLDISGFGRPIEALFRASLKNIVSWTNCPSALLDHPGTPFPKVPS
jgi:hypothetical protein